MALMHEKRAAPTKATPFPNEGKNRQRITNPVNSNTTRKPRSELFSLTFDGWSLVWLLTGHAVIVVSMLSMIVGGQNG